MIKFLGSDDIIPKAFQTGPMKMKRIRESATILYKVILAGQSLKWHLAWQNFLHLDKIPAGKPEGWRCNNEVTTRQVSP